MFVLINNIQLTSQKWLVSCEVNNKLKRIDMIQATIFERFNIRIKHKDAAIHHVTNNSFYISSLDVAFIIYKILASKNIDCILNEKGIEYIFKIINAKVKIITDDAHKYSEIIIENKEGKSK